MKKKRILADIMVLVLTILSIPCFAAAETKINPISVNGNTVTISGAVPTPKSRVYIQVTRNGADMLDADNTYAARQVYAGEDGEFSIGCEMPMYDRKDTGRPVDGYFTAYVITAGTDRASIDFSYAAEQNREKFFSELNAARASANGLKLFMNNKDNKIYFDLYNVLIEEYYAISDEKKLVLCGSLESGEAFDDKNIGAINDAIITSRLNGLKDRQAAKEVIESEEIFSKCSFSYGDITYENLDETGKNWFYDVVLPHSAKNEFTAPEQLNDIFVQSIVLYEINNTHYSKLLGVLKSYAGILKLDTVKEYRDILSLSDAKAEGVMKKLKDSSDGFTDVEQLASAVAQAYKSYNSDSTANGGGSGGGSGSSSSKKGSSASSVISGSIPTAGDTKKDEENVPEKKYFSDLENYSWVENEINILAAAGIVSGDGNESFNPGGNVTRAEFVTMLMKAIDMVDEDAECDFEDVPKNDWSYKYVASAFATGITSGVDDKHFGKNTTITRQEAAAFLHRAAVRMYLPLDNDSSEQFADEEDIADWALRSVKVMKAAGLINGVGDNRFEPHGVTTRAQAAKMIYELYKLA